MIRVLIADDSDAYRSAIGEVVAATPGFTVVAEVDSGERAVKLAAALKPDLALIDLRMPGLDGAAAAEQIAAHRAETTVVLMTADSGVDAEIAGFQVHDKGTLTMRRLKEIASRRDEAPSRRFRRASDRSTRRPQLVWLRAALLAPLGLTVTCLGLCMLQVEPVHGWMVHVDCPFATWGMDPPSDSTGQTRQPLLSDRPFEAPEPDFHPPTRPRSTANLAG
jgi:CheY-like chemotaxis protein